MLPPLPITGGGHCGSMPGLSHLALKVQPVLALNPSRKLIKSGAVNCTSPPGSIE
nr:hypothetical protein [Bacteroidota bacterium]